MKNNWCHFIIAIVSTVFASQSWAAQTTSLALPATETKSTGSLIEGWSATAHVSTSNQLSSRGVNNGTTADVKFSSNPAGGLGLRYGMVKDHEVGFLIGASYEFDRQVESITVSNKNGTSGGGIDKKTRFSMILPEANATYGFNKNYYGLAGLNYPFPQTTDFEDITIRGELGTQIGLGAMADRNIHVEALYRTLNLPWYSTNAYSIESRLWGFLFRAGYAF